MTAGCVLASTKGKFIYVLAYIGVDLAGILDGGRMASAEGGLVPNGMGGVSPPQPARRSGGAYLHYNNKAAHINSYVFNKMSNIFNQVLISMSVGL